MAKKKEKDFEDMTPLERALQRHRDYMAGRPSKYDVSYCEIAIKFLSEGYSKQALAGELGICEKTLYTWEKKYPEFLQSIKEGEKLSQKFWEDKAIKHLTHSKNSKQLNSTIWIFNMKNRFGWTDKKEIDFGEKTLPTIKLAYSLEEEDADKEDQENN